MIWPGWLAAGLGVALAAAAEPAPVVPLPPIFAPKPAPPEAKPERAGPLRLPPTRRANSPEVSRKLSEIATQAAAAAAARTAPAAARAPAAPADEAGITKLDPYYVEEAKAVRLKDRDILTAAGRLAEARRLNPGLRPGGIPLLNDLVGQELLAEENAKTRRQEEAELRAGLEIGGAAIPPALRRTLDAGGVRNNEWAAQSWTRFKPLQ